MCTRIALLIRCEQGRNSLLCAFNVRIRDGFTYETGSTNAKKCPCGHFLRWWNRRELNPRPKTPWHNLLRGHSFYWNSPQGAPNDRLAYRVAILCMTDSMAKGRCMFTTNLTHGGSRSPHPRYGRHYCRITAYAARATLLLSFII